MFVAQQGLTSWMYSRISTIRPESSPGPLSVHSWNNFGIHGVHCCISKRLPNPVNPKTCLAGPAASAKRYGEVAIAGDPWLFLRQGLGFRA